MSLKLFFLAFINITLRGKADFLNKENNRIKYMNESFSKPG